MSDGSARNSLVDGGVETKPARRAAGALDAHAHDLGAALRRAVPFLVRRGVEVAAGPAHPSATLISALGDLASPTYVMHLATDPGGFRAVLVLDATANAFLIDGALGGDGQKPPTLDEKGLTGPQTALVGRIAQRIVEAFSTALVGTAGFGFTRLPATAGGPASDMSFASMQLTLGPEGQNGKLALLVAREALLASTQPAAPRTPSYDPRVVATMHDVEVDLVVELGRVTMSLGAITGLRVGDMLRLDVPLDGTVAVRCGDAPILTGIPTTSGSRLAVRIASRHGA